MSSPQPVQKSSNAAVARGMRSLGKSSRAEIEQIRHVEGVAQKYFAEHPSVSERTAIDEIAGAASVSHYLASYAVDKLRSAGEIKKNWRTGHLNSNTVPR